MNRCHPRWRVWIALAALSLSACASGGGAGIRGYAEQRLADLAEVAHLSAGSGKGLSLDLRIGALSQPSIGVYGAKTVAVGLLEPDVAGFIAETSVSAPYSYRYARANGASVLEALNFSGWRTSYAVAKLQRGFEEVDKPLAPVAPREYGETIEGRRFGGQIRGGRWLPLPSFADRFAPALQFKTATELSVGGHVAIFAGRAGVNPLEFVDFLLGFAGIDIAQDDGVRDFSARSAYPRGVPIAQLDDRRRRDEPRAGRAQGAGGRGSQLLQGLLGGSSGERSEPRAEPSRLSGPGDGRIQVIVNRGYSAVAERPGRSSFSAITPGTR